MLASGFTPAYQLYLRAFVFRPHISISQNDLSSVLSEDTLLQAQTRTDSRSNDMYVKHPYEAGNLAGFISVADWIGSNRETENCRIPLQATGGVYMNYLELWAQSALLYQ